MMTQEFEEIVSRISSVILGKKPQIRLALTCFFARGHLLIEDFPGIGKTTLAKAWAFLHGRNHTLPEDLQHILPWVAGHRLRDAQDLTAIPRNRLMELFSSVPVPV